MKIYAAADLHGHLPTIPEDADLFLIGGDLSPRLSENKQFAWLTDSLPRWLNKVPCPVVFTPGNWDVNFDLNFSSNDRLWKLRSFKWTVLIDEEFEIDGLKIWGSPWQLRMADMGFNLPDEDALREKWQLSPLDVDILLTHSPPFGFGDMTGRREHRGSTSLRARLELLRPTLSVFGHIHPGRGLYSYDGLTIANAAIVNNRYEPVHPLYWFSVEDRKIVSQGTFDAFPDRESVGDSARTDRDASEGV